VTGSIAICSMARPVRSTIWSSSQRATSSPIGTPPLASQLAASPGRRS
jgi:hypothetical protein